VDIPLESIDCNFKAQVTKQVFVAVTFVALIADCEDRDSRCYDTPKDSCEIPSVSNWLALATRRSVYLQPI